MTTIQAQLIPKKDTAANWASTNPVLDEGEWGYETDTGVTKRGDGTTVWLSLLKVPFTAADMPFTPGGTVAATTVQAAIAEVASEAANTVTSVAGKTGAVTLVPGDVGAETAGTAVLKSTVTAKGDLYAATASAAPARLPVGSDTQVLTVDSAQAAGVKWAAAPVTSVASKTGAVTLTGSDVAYTPSGTIAANTVAGAIAEAASEAAQLATYTTKGDIVAATGSAAVARVGVGATGQFLIPDSTQSTGLKWSRTSKPWQFHVADAGAVGDNSTDDTAAIQTAIDNAVTYATGHDYYAEVVFDPLTYVVSSAMTQRSGTVNGFNFGVQAQLCLPCVDPTGRKVILAFVGAKTLSHVFFQSAVPHHTGTIIRSTLTSQANATVNGLTCPPTVFGVPRTSGSNNFSNLVPHFDNIMVAAPQNPTQCGFDLLRAAGASWTRFGFHAYAAAVTNAPLITTLPTNTLPVGCIFPNQGNNDQVSGDEFWSFGCYTGASISEHFNCRAMRIVYGHDAVFVQGTGTNIHGATINQLSVEQHTNGILAANTAGMTFSLNIQSMHTEAITGADVSDTGSRLTGEIHWEAITRSAPSLTGATRMRVINDKIGPGAITGTVNGISLPAVPASTTPLTNPYARDCAVTIVGGTVTVVAVDGQTTGVTAGTVILPAGKAITLTYSVAPTMTWTAL